MTSSPKYDVIIILYLPPPPPPLTPQPLSCLAATSCPSSRFPVILARESERDTGVAVDPELPPQATIPGSLAGIILRNQLLVLLSDRAIDTVRYAQRPPQDDRRNFAQYEKMLAEKDRIIKWPTFEKTYPRYPLLEDVIESLKSRQDVLESWIDLSPYVGLPYTAQEHAPLMRTFKVFRHLGLRHLVVTSNSPNTPCEAVGLITRKLLDHEYTHHVWESFHGGDDHAKPGHSDGSGHGNGGDDGDDDGSDDGIGDLLEPRSRVSTDPVTINRKEVVQDESASLLETGNSVGANGMELRVSQRIDGLDDLDRGNQEKGDEEEDEHRKLV